MKTIAIDACGEIDLFRFHEMPIPKPGRNEIRVKIYATGFNPVDFKMRQGGIEGNFPLILGVDFSGVIDAVGDHVRDFEEGDEVFGLAIGPCSNGSYAEYVCLPAAFVTKKPKNLTFEEAGAISVTYLTAFQALVGKGALQKNRPFFLSGGSGGVGSATLALSKVYETGPPFTMAGSEESVNYLIQTFSIPSDHILRYRGLSQEEMAKQLIAMNGNKRFYFVLDFVGGKVKNLCFEVVDILGHLATPLPEEESFPIQIWGRKSNPFWWKSLSFHMIYVFVPALSGEEKDWNIYKTQLMHLAHLFEKEGLIPPQVENIGPFSVETVKKAHSSLEGGHTKGKLVMSHSTEQ